MNNHCNMSSTSSTAPMSTPSPSPRREDITGSTFGAGSYLTPGAWPGPGPGSHSGPSPLPPGQTSTIDKFEFEICTYVIRNVYNGSKTDGALYLI